MVSVITYLLHNFMKCYVPILINYELFCTTNSNNNKISNISKLKYNKMIFSPKTLKYNIKSLYL